MKFDLEKFNGRNDFSISRVKMRAMLVHQGLSDALLGEDNILIGLIGSGEEGYPQEDSQCDHTEPW